MTVTATEPTTATTTATDTKTPVTSKATTDTTASKTPVTTDTTAKPIDPTIAKLEVQADKLVAAGNKTGMALAAIVVDLYVRKAWEAHDMSVADYFLSRGIGSESGFVLSKTGRQDVVKRMATAAPDAPNSALCQLTGASLRTIANDRAELGVANTNRQDGQKNREDIADDNGTDAGDTTDKPAKTSKTRVQTVNVIEIIDALQDAQFITMIIAHASARLAELSTPAKAAA
jgi:hypothetical protein